MIFANDAENDFMLLREGASLTFFETTLWRLLAASKHLVLPKWFDMDNIIERLDQGHLYPLGTGTCMRRDKHVTGGARTSAPLQSRRTLYLNSYLDSL